MLTSDSSIFKSLGRKSPVVYPLSLIIAFGLSLGAATGIYSLFKNDVMLNHKAKLPPWERMDLEHPQPLKLLILRQKLEYDPEYRQLKADINKDILEQ